jgi:hypothetical protein
MCVYMYMDIKRIKNIYIYRERERVRDIETYIENIYLDREREREEF